MAVAVSPPVHPSFFSTIEAKAVHMAATVLSFEQACPPLMNMVIQAGEAEVLALCPGLAPFMPQITTALADLKPFLAQLLAELTAVEAIPVKPAS